MPPRKTKTRGKKRRSGTKGKKYPKTFKRLMEKMYRGTQKRGRAAARYARRNPGRIAGGLAGAGALGLAGYEGYLAARRGTNFIPGMESDAYASPTGRAFRRGRRGVTAARDYFNDPNRDMRGDISRRVRGAYTGARKRAGAAYTEAYNDAKATGRAAKGIFFDSLFPRRNNRRQMSEMLYGKRKRRRRRKKKFGGHCVFGKKAKKPSAATRRMCKKLKVRLTTKRGGKRVYKSEAMLKKQCKKAMKRKSKK